MDITLFRTALAKANLPEAPNPSRFEAFYVLLSEWNRHHNLIRFERESSFIDLHLVDSLLLHPLLPRGGTVVDIGSGAGFPGIPLALYDPSLQVVLIESRKKKSSFLSHAKLALDIQNASVWDLRAEPQNLKTRLEGTVRKDQPLVLASRATLSLVDLLKLALPTLKAFPNSRLISMKGPQGEVEIGESKLKVLLDKNELTLYENGPYSLPLSGAKRLFYTFCSRRGRPQ